jgi:hypothetical protein
MYVGRDAIDVDVFETGPLYAFAFASKERPAQEGISIGRALDSPIDAGTFGCLVTDLTDQTLGILSNNHVLANENAATIGDEIVQPGAYDGGASPGDNIATLKRFVTINATGNTVDCALAQVTDPATVVNQIQNNLMQPPSREHPAVGLLFAGGCNRTIMNPINGVLSALNVQFVSGPGATVAASVGMNVEKVGRTTEYTSSTITEIDLTVTIGYNFGNATFDHQIATAWLSDPGDSGSIVCRGGQGGKTDHCGCAATSSASQALGGVDVGLDAAIEKEFRHRYLQHTRVGRYLIDVFFRNEQLFVRRLQDAHVSDEDRAFVRSLYDRHIAAIRSALLQPERGHFTQVQARESRELVSRATQYMTEEEARAANELAEILIPQLEGRTVTQILESLNDEELAERIREILSRVPTLHSPYD